jgi:ATP-dependent RNA helicase DDX49/DBP8
MIKDNYLIYLLQNDFKDKTTIIFTGKCRTAEHLRIMLHELGIRSTSLHSQMSQQDRLGSLAKFRTSVVDILIATDVGSR